MPKKVDKHVYDHMVDLIGCVVLLNTKVQLKTSLMKMKMFKKKKKQVVQEWSLQHRKIEVFDGTMVYSAVNGQLLNRRGRKRAGHACFNIPS
ncbi:unnamed protein product, partial [Brassica oleracea var. botrytis]